METVPPELIDDFRMNLLPLIAVANWALSFLFCKNSLDWMADLRSLWPESKSFFKKQLVFLLLMVAGNVIALSGPPNLQTGYILPSGNTDLLDTGKGSDTTLFIDYYGIAGGLSQGIGNILELFYVSQLGSTSALSLIPTIGIWTMFKLFLGESVLGVITTWSFVIIITGPWLLSKTVLFMPIFACEGHRLLHSLKRMFQLSKGKYWLISRYLGPLMVVSSIMYTIVAYSKIASAALTLRPAAYLINFVMGSLILTVNLAGVGMSYKLYSRLKAGQEESQLAEETVGG